MRVLTGILAMTILLSEFSAVTFGHAIPNKRSTPAKCTSSQPGFYFDGSTGASIDNTASPAACQNLCEQDSICYGWRYYAPTSSCWLQTSIGTKYTAASYTGGACIGPAAKQTCTEVLPSTYYSGDSGSAISNIATSALCMSQCNAAPTCLGWSYSSSAQQCWLQTTVYGKITDAHYTGGSCITPQAPYPIISLDTFRQQVLTALNTYRSKHGAPALTLDSEMDDIAQAYAQTLATSKTMVHSGNTYHGNYMGENLYAISGSSGPLYTKGNDSVSAWYNEISAYNWTNPGFGLTTGHFTQLVWKGTKLVGVGRALSSDGTTLYVVSNFYPGGNIGGGYIVNVQTPS